jgi:hypothetical protein
MSVLQTAWLGHYGVGTDKNVRATTQVHYLKAEEANRP